MPTYDYECAQCGSTVEVFQSMSDPSIPSCATCNTPMRRLIGGGLGVIFKGSGFYSTDSRGGATKSQNPATERKDSGDKADTSKGGNSPDTPSASKNKGGETTTSTKEKEKTPS